MEEENEIKHEPIESLIKNGYEFRTEQYIKTAYKIYRKYFWEFVGFYAIMMVISLAVFMILGLSTGTSMFSFGNQVHTNPYISNLIIGPIVNFFSFLLVPGVFIVARKINFEQRYSFDNFFDGTKHWKQLLFASLISYAITLIFFSLPMKDLMSFFFKSHFNDNPSYQNLTTPLLFKSKLLAGIFIIIGIYFTIAFAWIQQYIVFSGMNYFKAIMSSLKVISKRWFSFLGLYIAIGAITILPIIVFSLFMIAILALIHMGHFIPKILLILIWIIPCILWMFVAYPMLYLSLYTAFEDVVGTFNNEQSAMNNEQSVIKGDNSDDKKPINPINTYRIWIIVVFIFILAIFFAFLVRSSLKNQLNDYAIVNMSLERTAENNYRMINAYIEDIGSEYLKNPDKVRASRDSILKLQNYSNEVVSYIDSLKYGVIAKTEGIAFEYARNLSLAGLKQKDNYEIPTNYFLGDTLNGAISKASELKKRINLYRKELINILGKDSAVVIPSLSTKGIYKKIGGNVSWESGNFNHVILAGTMTVLNKIISDVRDEELKAIRQIVKDNDLKLQ